MFSRRCHTAIASRYQEALLITVWPLVCAIAYTGLTSCAGPARASGTYVAHSASFVEILQLTEANDGRVDGLLSTVSLDDHGQLRSQRLPLSGRTDHGTITLGTFAGTLTRKSIQIQMAAQDGKLLSEIFERADESQLQRYTDALQTKAQSIAFNNKVSKLTTDMEQTVESAAKWMQEAQVHVDRIPNVHGRYKLIEDRMIALLDRERVTANSVDRSQLSVGVNQEGIEGTQLDIAVKVAWDPTLMAGPALLNKLKSYSSTCLATDSRLPDPVIANAWRQACQSAMQTSGYFDRELREVSETWNELTTFQNTALQKRQVLVQRAERMTQ